MREDDSNWFAKWEEELPPPDELMPISQTLITPDLALAFDIRNHPMNQNHQPPPLPVPPPSSSGNPSSIAATSSEFAAEESAEFGSNGNGGGADDDQARTLKRPRLVWTPQLHKRFVDAVAHLGIKNAVPKTIMQLMSVDGLTRENVASHLQKYRLYLKRMQGLPSGGGGGNCHGGGGGDSATDRLFASSPVPAHFLHPGGRPTSDHFLPFVPVTALQQHHQQMAAAAAAAGVAHPQYHRQIGQFDHPFLARQAPPSQQQQQAVPRMGPPVQNVEDLESSAGNGNDGGRKALTLFPTAED